MTRRPSRQKWIPRGLLLATGVIVAMGAVMTPASAVPGQQDTGQTQANVSVDSAITLTNLTPSFTLTGIPGDTPTADVSMVVTTNNAAGYAVVVQPQTPALEPTQAGNTDSIPIDRLQVRGSDPAGAFIPLTYGAPTAVTVKPTPSAEGGDPLTNTYRMTIPFVTPDTYSATLEYIAVTL
jgi:hypothetical protein